MKDLVRDEMVEFAAEEGAGPLPAAADLAALADAAAAACDASRAEFLRRFGRHLFGRLAVRFPVFVTDDESMLDFLGSLEARVHEELRKLDSALAPPRLACTRLGRDRLVLVYRSSRGLGDLAEGMLLGCSEHFGETVEIARTALVGEPGERFELQLR